MHRREAVRDFFEVRLGTPTPQWRITGDSNALCFMDCAKTPSLLVALDGKQASEVRGLSTSSFSAAVTLNIAHEKYLVYMSGRKVDQHKWEGTASAYTKTVLATPLTYKDIDPAVNVVSLFAKQFRTR